MELLRSRMRQRGELPGFSKVVNAIIGAMRGDDVEFNMTKTVLQDPALTQKVLRLANSAMYAVFGQGINTVSKAVIVLGTEAIGHLALGLKLIDGLSAISPDSVVAREEMEKAIFAGHIARHVASSAGTRDAEEAAVCAMLHSLGRMLVTFYLFERWQQIQERCAETGISEEQAAHQVLGLGLDEIGGQTARQWGLPANVVHTMRDVPPAQVDEPLEHNDWLGAVSTLSSRCAGAFSKKHVLPGKALEPLAHDYAQMLGLEMPQVLAALESAQKSITEENAGIMQPRKHNEIERVMESSARKQVDATLILTCGISDMRGALHSASLNQLLTMALETVYQGLGISRAIAFLRNPEQAQYAARIWFGESVQDILPRLVFGDAYQPDVFHAALANDKMIFVENAQHPDFISKLPRWWREALPSVRSFMVLPLTLNQQPIGFIYGDWGSSASVAKIEESQAVLLNELRMLIGHAVDQRRQMELSWARKML